jgi:hypothetical protein
MTRFSCDNDAPLSDSYTSFILRQVLEPKSTICIALLATLKADRGSMPLIPSTSLKNVGFNGCWVSTCGISMAGNCASRCIGLPFELCLDAGELRKELKAAPRKHLNCPPITGGPREVGVGRSYSESLTRMPSCQAVDFLNQTRASAALRAALPVTRPENDCSKGVNSCNYFLCVNNHSAS